MEWLTDWLTDYKIPVGKTAKVVNDWLNDNLGGFFDLVSVVMETLIEAVFLVVIVILVFLQKWRAAIIPELAIPVIGVMRRLHGSSPSISAANAPSFSVMSPEPLPARW